KVSAEDLSKILDPKPKARTVRHRLAKLREDGYLVSLYTLSHEPKIGVGDGSFVVNEVIEHSALVREAIETIPWFYYIGTTYGTFNGYFVHGMYPLDRPNTTIEFLELLKEYGVITDYYNFINTDYESRRGDFKDFEPGVGWNWDWDQWVEDSKKMVADKKTVPIHLDYELEQISYDYKDIILLKQMKKEAKTTLRELSGLVELSETQVKRRLDRLEAEGVIKGYRWILANIEEPLFVLCFVDIKEDPDSVISCFYQLPFPKEIMMESRTKYLVRLRLPGSEVGGLLKGFDFLKPNLNYYTFQVTNEFAGHSLWTQLDFYDIKSKSWKFEPEKYLAKVRKLLESRLG
ncbi:MAG: winged helix-turn-helix transcriptional regulator, partial [Candidatus Thorarchaeota archaeon]